MSRKVIVTCAVTGAGVKKLHLAHEMRSGSTLIATEEVLALHVDSGTGRTVPFTALIATAITDHQPPNDSAAPEWIGRTVSA
jgi:acyl-CoA thioester hydrolase